MLLVLSCKVDNSSYGFDSCNKDEISASRLVSVENAKLYLETDSTYLPIEVSNAKEYDNGHITNALNVWRPDFRSKLFTEYKGMMCSQTELQILFQNLGVTSNTQLLVYDNKGGCDAMRLAWVFDYYGVQNYQIINGGKTAWTQAGYALDTLSVTPTPNPNYVLSVAIDSSLCADRYDVIAGLNDPNVVIVDTRETYEYLGKPFIADDQVWKYKKGAFERGCIPGAIHLNWSELSDLANDHRIKCKKDLIYNLESKGITKDKSIIVYCQSGSRSSHTAFVLREILNYPNVKNYDGSWIEWSYYHMSNGQLPIAKITNDKLFAELELELTQSLNK